MLVKSKKIRESARLEECAFCIPGVCSFDAEQTVLCHLPDESHGTALKAHDISAAYGCMKCHDVIDGRAKAPEWMSESDREQIMRRAMVRTLVRLVDKGILVVRGYGT